jgi:hypothetical protein
MGIYVVTAVSDGYVERLGNFVGSIHFWEGLGTGGGSSGGRGGSSKGGGRGQECLEGAFVAGVLVYDLGMSAANKAVIEGWEGVSVVPVHTSSLPFPPVHSSFLSY